MARYPERRPLDGADRRGAMIGYRHIHVACDGRVTTVMLNRPEVMNAINPEMHFELADAFDRFAADRDQFVCVVTGAGSAFCAGSDLKAAGEHRGYPPSGYAGLIERWDCPNPSSPPSTAWRWAAGSNWRWRAT